MEYTKKQDSGKTNKGSDILLFLFLTRAWIWDNMITVFIMNMKKVFILPHERQQT